MKLISLNTWGGKVFAPLMDFVKQHSVDTDIFCFQEIYDTTSGVKQHQNINRANLLEEVKQILPNFQIFYFPVLIGYDEEANSVDFDLKVGPAIFVKNSIAVKCHEDKFIYKNITGEFLKKDFSNLSIPLQYINFYLDNKEFSIFNFHGVPAPGDKLDTERRLQDTRAVKDIMDSKTGAKILVGDFNLLPETQSIKTFGDLRNLIKEFNIEKTRSALSPFFGRDDFQKFADYTFVSPDINVSSFVVPDIQISDHLPMILEFS